MSALRGHRSATVRPYGAVHHSSGTMPTTYNFTGQRLDSETGLLYYNFRYYDPVSGRFVRADTVDTNAGGKDPYAYVGDSPENKGDPTGHDGSWWQTASL
ncbi:MAG TPA: RHS repeat-associated core domain-containing protein [Ktedonobacteraceae bacterium]|nr:RHS repeat-associated core domain-containing protein [Ktedonobacteraceae bacterium]